MALDRNPSYVFESAFSDRGAKNYWRGTQRIVDPRRTVELAEAAAPSMGITRVANVTGLDVIGIPVIMAIRPNSRSLSVSQGKGLTLDAAKASGLMESIELYHAEHIEAPLRYATLSEMRARGNDVDADALPRPMSSSFHADLKILWIQGYDLLVRRDVWIPFELVSIDCSVPLPPGHGSFSITSNGLASGNNLLEAVCHGVAEVIERDATTISAFSKSSSRVVDTATIHDIDCISVLNRFREVGITVEVLDITSDIGIPAFRCVISDPARRATVYHHRAGGFGCHLDKNVAMLRALTEAAQSRLTLIAGSRDDMKARSYQRGIDPWAAGDGQKAKVRSDFNDIESLATTDLRDDVDLYLQRLAAIGVSSVVAVDLSKPEHPFSVVRIVIPGLETLLTSFGYRPGNRAQAAMDAT